MPTKEARMIKKGMKERMTELKNFKMAWKYLSFGLRIILALGLLTTIWIIFKLGQFLRILFMVNS